MKKIAIIQSNYIPWKGYFDIIGAVDEFIFYDDVQFTKNDWRNRNLIKTQAGVKWISVPVGQSINRRIRDVVIEKHDWQIKHWKTLETNYSKASFFKEISDWLKPIYLDKKHHYLSKLNRELIESINRFLSINTKLKNSWDYEFSGGRSENIISMCKKAGASIYLTGSSARSYLNEKLFTFEGIKVEWMDYSGYPEYKQLWGKFSHNVSILDLLFNCGKSAVYYMKLNKIFKK